MPPISIEEFAAYLDGNLSDDEMERVLSVIEYDESMQNISFHNESVEEYLADCEYTDLTLPEELSSLDFEIPQIDDTMNFDNSWEELEIAACDTDTIYDVPFACDDSSTLSSPEENEAYLQTESIDDFSGSINNDVAHEHHYFENDLPEIND